MEIAEPERGLSSTVTLWLRERAIVRAPRLVGVTLTVALRPAATR